jgi:hypothetical protein
VRGAPPGHSTPYGGHGPTRITWQWSRVLHTVALLVLHAAPALPRDRASTQGADRGLASSAHCSRSVPGSAITETCAYCSLPAGACRLHRPPLTVASAPTTCARWLRPRARPRLHTRAAAAVKTQGGVAPGGRRALQLPALLPRPQNRAGATESLAGGCSQRAPALTRRAAAGVKARPAAVVGAAEALAGERRQLPRGALVHRVEAHGPSPPVISDILSRFRLPGLGKQFPDTAQGP